MGECEIEVTRKTPCQSSDEECVALRHSNPDHYHMVTSACGTKREEAIPVCYLPFKSRLAHLFRSELQCHKHLALWRGVRKFVLDGEPVTPDRSRTAIWDGDRVLDELPWFWDPNRMFMLPGFCEHCGVILSATYIMSKVNPEMRASLHDGDVVSVPCRSCQRETAVPVLYVPGNPRNQLLKLHMDGWLPHGIGPRSKRNVSSIEVMSGCLSNYESGKTENVTTLAFVPESSIPHGAAGTKFLSALLSVVVDELVDLFVEGVEVPFAYEMPELDGTLHDSANPETTRIRVILIVLLADLPARAKLGGFKDGGIGGCYMCEAISESMDGGSTYYYPAFIRQYYSRPRCKDHEYAEMVSCFFYFNVMSI